VPILSFVWQCYGVEFDSFDNIYTLHIGSQLTECHLYRYVLTSFIISIVGRHAVNV